MGKQEIAKREDGRGGPTDLVHTDDTFVDATIARHQTEAQEEIRMAVLLARQFPRDEMASYEKMMTQCRRPKFAEKGLYSYPRGGTTVEGPSINLARTLAQKWGNMRWGIEVIHDTPSTRKIRAWAWDMESNTRVSAEDEFEKVIYRKDAGLLRLDGSGKDDERSLRELTFRKASLILRGCLLQLIPADFVEDASEVCKDSMADSELPREERIKMMLVSLNSIGVTKEQIENRLQHKLEATGEPELVELRNIYNAMKDGHGDAKEYFTLPKAGRQSQNETVPSSSEASESSQDGDNFKGAGKSRDTPSVETEPEAGPESASGAKSDQATPTEGQDIIDREHPLVGKLYSMGGPDGLELTREVVKEILDYRFAVSKFTELTEAKAEEMILLYEVLEVAKDRGVNDEILTEMVGEHFQRDKVLHCSVGELNELKSLLEGS